MRITISYLLSFLLAFIITGCQKGIDKVSDIVSVNTNGSGIDSGEIFFDYNTKTAGVLNILDQSGNIIKAKSLAPQVDNFQKWNINGTIRYTYFQTAGSYTIDSIPGTELGYEYICDSNFNILKRVSLLPYGNIDTATSSKIDVHEFILIDDNHYIVESYRPETPANIPDSLDPLPGKKVVGCVIQEINNGQVVFQWHGTDFPEFYGASVENNDFSNSATMDYMHLNSICIDSSDNNLICSFRNLNEIVKINRLTGAIMWRLGGKNSDFALTSDESFLRQHYARVINGEHTLIFLDNGDADLRASSRVLEFQLDENNKQVTSFNAYKIPDAFIQYGGSVQKINDTYFIGGSSAKYVLQVNYNTNEVLLRLSQTYASYRCLKYPVN